MSPCPAGQSHCYFQVIPSANMTHWRSLLLFGAQCLHGVSHWVKGLDLVTWPSSRVEKHRTCLDSFGCWMVSCVSQNRDSLSCFAHEARQLSTTVGVMGPNAQSLSGPQGHAQCQSCGFTSGHSLGSSTPGACQPANRSRDRLRAPRSARGAGPLAGLRPTGPAT